MMLYLDWLGSGFSYLGVYLLPRDRKRAVITWMVGNAVWGAWALYTGNYATLVMQVVMSLLHVRTLLTWRAVANAQA